MNCVLRNTWQLLSRCAAPHLFFRLHGLRQPLRKHCLDATVWQATLLELLPQLNDLWV